MAMTRLVRATGLPTPTWDFLLSRNSSGWQGLHLLSHVSAAGGQGKCAGQLEAKFTMLFLCFSLVSCESLMLSGSSFHGASVILKLELLPNENMIPALWMEPNENFNYSKQNIVWQLGVWVIYTSGCIISCISEANNNLSVMIVISCIQNKTNYTRFSHYSDESVRCIFPEVFLVFDFLPIGTTSVPNCSFGQEL